MEERQTIVVAWAEQSALVPTGRMIRRDGVNYFPEFKTGWEGKAAIWVRRGTKADLEKATRYANANGCRVFVFPIEERDPLGKARKAVMAAVQPK